MENTAEFQQKLSDLIKQMELKDDTVAFILLGVAEQYFFKTLTKCRRCPLNNNGDNRH